VRENKIIIFEFPTSHRKFKINSIVKIAFNNQFAILLMLLHAICAI
jgi:hypothetical protein